MKATIKPINYDLINDKVEIIIGGMKNKWITGNEYRILRNFATKWTSGLRFVKEKKYNEYQTTLYFNENNTIKHICYGGIGECSIIKEIIS